MDLIQLESGKKRLDALEEVVDVAINARYYAAHRCGAAAAQEPHGLRSAAHLHQGVPAPQGSGRGHRALELPVHVGDERLVARARRRQRRGRQARPRLDVQRPAGQGPARPGRLPRGTGAGRLRRGPGGRPRGHRPRRLRHVHRLDQDRSPGRGEGCGPPRGVQPRAGRQERDARARRRPAEADRQRHVAGRVLECRPAVRVDGAALRGGRDLRPVRVGSAACGRRHAHDSPTSGSAPTSGRWRARLSSTASWHTWTTPSHVVRACWPAGEPGRTSDRTTSSRPSSRTSTDDGRVRGGDVRPRGLAVSLHRRRRRVARANAPSSA